MNRQTNVLDISFWKVNIKKVPLPGIEPGSPG